MMQMSINACACGQEAAQVFRIGCDSEFLVTESS